jgi:hypothetical protein
MIPTEVCGLVSSDGGAVDDVLLSDPSVYFPIQKDQYGPTDTSINTNLQVMERIRRYVMLSKHVVFSALLILSIMLSPFQVEAKNAGGIDSVSTNVFLNDSFVLRAVRDVCNYKEYRLTIESGTEIFGTIKANTQVSFFIMTQAQFNRTSLRCGAIASSDMMLNTGPITSYSVDWVARQTDEYHFIILNGSSNDAFVFVTFWTYE